MTTAGPSQRGRDGTGDGKPQEMMQHNAQRGRGATVPAAVTKRNAAKVERIAVQER